MLLYLVISRAIAVYFVYKLLLLLAHGLNFAVYRGACPLLPRGVYALELANYSRLSGRRVAHSGTDSRYLYGHLKHGQTIYTMCKHELTLITFFNDH